MSISCPDPKDHQGGQGHLRHLRVPRPPQLSSRHLYLLGAVHWARVLPSAGPGRHHRRGVPVDKRAPRLSLGRRRILVSVFTSSDNYPPKSIFSPKLHHSQHCGQTFRSSRSTRYQVQRHARRHPHPRRGHWGRVK